MEEKVGVRSKTSGRECTAKGGDCVAFGCGSSSPSAIATDVSACSGAVVSSGDDDNTDPLGAPYSKGSGTWPGRRTDDHIERVYSESDVVGAGQSADKDADDGLLRKRSSWGRMRGEPTALFGMEKPNLEAPRRNDGASMPAATKGCSDMPMGGGPKGDAGDRTPSAGLMICDTEGSCLGTFEPRRSSTACKNSVALSVNVRRGRRRPLDSVGGDAIGVSVSHGVPEPTWGTDAPWIDHEPARWSSGGARWTRAWSPNSLPRSSE